jgi:hypothetical protein
LVFFNRPKWKLQIVEIFIAGKTIALDPDECFAVCLERKEPTLVYLLLGVKCLPLSMTRSIS